MVCVCVWGGGGISRGACKPIVILLAADRCAHILGGGGCHIGERES